MLPLKQNDCVIYASRILCVLDSIILAYQSSMYRFASVSVAVIIFAELGVFTFLRTDVLQDPRLSSIDLGLKFSIIVGESLVVVLFIWLITGWAVVEDSRNTNVWISLALAIFPYIYVAIKYTHDKIKEVKANPLPKQRPGVEDDTETIAEDYEIS